MGDPEAELVPVVNCAGRKFPMKIQDGGEVILWEKGHFVLSQKDGNGSFPLVDKRFLDGSFWDNAGSR